MGVLVCVVAIVFVQCVNSRCRIGIHQVGQIYVQLPLHFLLCAGMWPHKLPLHTQGLTSLVLTYQICSLALAHSSGGQANRVVCFLRENPSEGKPLMARAFKNYTCSICRCYT